LTKAVEAEQEKQDSAKKEEESGDDYKNLLSPDAEDRTTAVMRRRGISPRKTGVIPFPGKKEELCRKNSFAAHREKMGSVEFGNPL